MKPLIRHHSEQQSCNFAVPCDKFIVHFGYKERDSIQVRLDVDGVFVSDWRDSRFPDQVHQVTLPPEAFMEEFAAWARYLETKYKGQKK